MIDDGNEVDATITLADAGAALNFWKTALPRAGFRVTHTDSGAGSGEIDFTGRICGQGSQIAITGSTAAVQCKRG